MFYGSRTWRIRPHLFRGSGPVAICWDLALDLGLTTSPYPALYSLVWSFSICALTRKSCEQIGWLIHIHFTFSSQLFTTYYNSFCFWFWKCLWFASEKSAVLGAGRCGAPWALAPSSLASLWEIWSRWWGQSWVHQPSARPAASKPPVAFCCDVGARWEMCQNTRCAADVVKNTGRRWAEGWMVRKAKT